jgi:hypothetical protein
MPVHADGHPRTVSGPGPLAKPKGKSCFHLKHVTAALVGQIAAALAAGCRRCEERGWV